MIIATISPNVSFKLLIAVNPFVGAFRFNTITPIGSRSKAEVLKELKELAGEKILYLDLKGRQLRITEWANPSMSLVKINHKISVNKNSTLYFKDHTSTILEVVNGDELLLDRPPKRAVGKGEPVNILDSTLKIEGYLTEDDKEYILAAKEAGLHNYMLSFLEEESDIGEVVSLNLNANIIAKIESKKGLRFVDEVYSRLKGIRLMAARDDLYINMGSNKLKMIEAEELIIEKDSSAVVASRILTSLEEKNQVSLGDISDLELLRRMGYKNFMLSDGMCGIDYAFSEAMKILFAFQKNIEGAGSE